MAGIGEVDLQHHFMPLTIVRRIGALSMALCACAVQVVPSAGARYATGDPVRAR